ncbi:MAG: calcium-binding protein, partial [bacterium]
VILILYLFLTTAILFPCHGSAKNPPELPDIDISSSPNGIVPLPENVDDIFKIFDRYTKIYAPNGKPIHILIEKGYTDRQAVYARKILTNHLTNVAHSLYGKNKATIANAMANNKAILTLFYSEESMRSPKARAFFESGVNAQDLREYETILEGTKEYMDQKNPTRDASYEEIMHLVQGYGIEPAHPTLSEKLFDAFWDARAKGLYTLDYNDTFEYFICGIEAYFDLWKHNPSGDGTREGEYIPLDHPKLHALDPAMYEIVEGFLGDHWQYTAEIANEFKGTFSLNYDKNLTYTNKSQYLRRAMLTGVNNSNLTGNNKNNSLFGNSGNNLITPLGGFDVIDGGAGIDTAVFKGPRHEYIIRQQDGRIIVNDLNYDRDGENILINIEKLQFKDKTIEVK